MKTGILFHKNPFKPSAGIDIVRLKAISKGLIEEGIDTEIIAPVEKEGIIDDIIPVKPLSYLSKNRYEAVKTCYHFSIELIEDYKGPVISRIVRVVDEIFPPRDEKIRDRLLKCQELINKRASLISLNNRENEERWRYFYGDKLPVILTPTGCHEIIPPPERNPYGSDRKILLFIGSICAGRMVKILNEMSERFFSVAEIHYIGRSKLNLYDGGEELSENIVCHGEMEEDKIWDYIRYASAGIAIATGPCPFDNDMSKIMNYLRGGLPVLSEEPIVNNELIRQLDYGKIFSYNDMDDLVIKGEELLNNPPVDKREHVMTFMAEKHSWKNIAGIYKNYLTLLSPSCEKLG
ncbi:MAG: hypothetical protein ABRQ37_07165 [Candidatus Eremiobacterota bacterium]